MKHQNFLEYLQNLHPASKIKILVVAGAVAALGMSSIWLSNLQSQFGDEVVPTGSVLSATNRVQIESTEVRDGKRYIYFKIENETQDILNFAATDKITLFVNEQETKPETVTDRQNVPFVKKILSNTTQFGTLVFPEFNDDKTLLILDGMYFETNPEQIFKETIEIDFDTLKTVEELRS